jgi:hypothetical protein
MYGKNRNDKILFVVLLGLVAVALGGSLWAWLGGSTCGACSGTRELLGGMNLAALGAGFYGILLALGTAFGRSRLFFSALLVAASAHVVLLLLLYQRGIFCVPCTVVGASAILCAAISFRADTDNLSRGSVLLPVGAVLTHAAILVLGFPRLPGMPEATLSLPPARPEAMEAAPAGTARLLVFTRAGCRYCDEFEEDVLPELLREFAGRLKVARDQAPASLPTPTIVISGQERTVFPGLPPIAQLRDAILRALGPRPLEVNSYKVDDESSMLPKPR